MAWVEKLSNGGWRASYRDADGVKHRRTFPKGKKKDAEAYLATVTVSRRQGTYTDPRLGRTTVRQFWPEFIAAPDLRPATRAQYASLAKGYILPRLGGRQLGALSPLDVERWVRELPKVTSIATTRAAFRVLRSMLSAAVAGGYVSRNVAHRIKLPSVERREMRALNGDELARIVEVVEPRYEALVLLLGLSGLRIGEAAALLPQDFDLLRRRVTITKAVSEVGGKLEVGPTKTGRNRAVPLPRVVCEAIARHMATFPAGEAGTVFAGPRGGILRRTVFRARVWLPALRKAGISGPVRVHDLRHTAAALAIESGGHPKLVQSMLGHGSITTTLDIYGHLFESLGDTLADEMDAGFRRAQERTHVGIDIRRA